jgi:hypothetical protein
MRDLRRVRALAGANVRKMSQDFGIRSCTRRCVGAAQARRAAAVRQEPQKESRTKFFENERCQSSPAQRSAHDFLHAHKRVRISCPNLCFQPTVSTVRLSGESGDAGRRWQKVFFLGRVPWRAPRRRRPAPRARGSRVLCTTPLASSSVTLPRFWHQMSRSLRVWRRAE